MMAVSGVLAAEDGADLHHGNVPSIKRVIRKLSRAAYLMDGCNERSIDPVVNLLQPATSIPHPVGRIGRGRPKVATEPPNLSDREDEAVWKCKRLLKFSGGQTFTGQLSQQYFCARHKRAVPTLRIFILPTGSIFLRCTLCGECWTPVEYLRLVTGYSWIKAAKLETNLYQIPNDIDEQQLSNLSRLGNIRRLLAKGRPILRGLVIDRQINSPFGDWAAIEFEELAMVVAPLQLTKRKRREFYLVRIVRNIFGRLAGIDVFSRNFCPIFTTRFESLTGPALIMPRWTDFVDIGEKIVVCADQLLASAIERSFVRRLSCARPAVAAISEQLSAAPSVYLCDQLVLAQCDGSSANCEDLFSEHNYKQLLIRNFNLGATECCEIQVNGTATTAHTYLP
jgi:hypothetical protein